MWDGREKEGDKGKSIWLMDFIHLYAVALRGD
jgi:hypothetical protein